MTKKIVLNPSERVLAVHIASGREENNLRKGFKEKKQCSRSGWDINFEGVCGEIACAKFLDVYPDTEYNVNNPPKHDLISRKGSTVDVKTTDKSKDSWATIISKGVNDVEKYMFVRGRFPVYEICGWLPSEEYINEENICDVGNGDFYRVDIDKLRKFK